MPKGNPNPNKATQFKPGVANGGRKKGDRDRLTAKCLYELAEDFEREGKAAIVKVRETDPARYLAAVIALVPKEVTVNTQPLDGMEDSNLTEAIETLTAALLAKVPSPPAEPEEPRVMQ